MDRLERLINLMAALLEADRPLDRAELRRRVSGYEGEGEEVDDATFRRMFERDKDALRQMGVPLVIEPIDPQRPDSAEGYRIPRERYELPDPGLDPEELAALRLAASAVSVGEETGGTTTATAALWKLGGGVENPSAFLAALPGSEYLGLLFGAVAERRTVRFPYQGRTRTVDPWTLSCRAGKWYLSGFDRDRQDDRMFRLDRMDAAPEPFGPAGSFERPSSGGGPPPPPWLLGDEERLVAELLVDAGQAALAAAEAAVHGQVEHRPDGSVILRLPVTSRAGFRSFVFGFLDHAEVLGPPELRRDVVEWLNGLAS